MTHCESTVRVPKAGKISRLEYPVRSTRGGDLDIADMTVLHSHYGIPLHPLRIMYY